LDCDFSGWYNFGKIVIIVATRCYILKLKCTKSISAGALPQTPLGSLQQRSPDSPARFNGPTSKRKKGRKGEEKEEGVKEGEGKVIRGEERKWEREVKERGKWRESGGGGGRHSLALTLA